MKNDPCFSLSPALQGALCFTCVSLVSACSADEKADFEGTAQSNNAMDSTSGGGSDSSDPSGGQNGTQDSSASMSTNGKGSEADSSKGADSDGTEAGDSDDSGPSGTRFDVGIDGDVPSAPGGPIPENCNQAAFGNSNVGCRFYAIDLDNNQPEVPKWGQFPVGVVISNVQETQSAEVVVERRIDGSWQVVEGPLEVAALSLHEFSFENTGDIGGGVYRDVAIRLSSDVPVIAYQFSPLDGQNSYSSDASMLLPFSSWDYTYEIVTHPAIDPVNPTYFVAVAAKDGTVVEITPSQPTLGGNELPAGNPGESFIVELDEGDAVDLQFKAGAGSGSLSGSTISSDSDHPIAVFIGGDCTNIPADKTACDHLEEQLPGTAQWGKHFIAARVPPRRGSSPESSSWQIYASEDDTSISFKADEEVNGLPESPQTLNAGEELYFYVSGSNEKPGDFEVVADKPIYVLNYMTSARNLSGTSREGDPAMVSVSPVEQFLPRYVVLVPPTWNNDFAVVTRKAGTEVTLDGELIADDSFRAVSDTGYEVARIRVEDGVHIFDGGEIGFAVTIVGYDVDDSYAYLGGVGTQRINAE